MLSSSIKSSCRSNLPLNSSFHPSGLPNFSMKSAKSRILIKPVPCSKNRKIQVANKNG